jgi:hypothetical protein
VVSEYPLDQIRVEQTKFDQEVIKLYDSIRIKHIILDFSCINLIDSMGVDALVKACFVELKYFIGTKMFDLSFVL